MIAIDRETQTDHIERVIHELIGRLCNVQPTQLTPHTDLREDLGADSLDMVELIVALGQKFELKVTEQASERVPTIDDVRTVGQIMALIRIDSATTHSPTLPRTG